MYKLFIVLIIASLFVSCNFSLKVEESGAPIARVNTSYLYKKDVAELVSEATSKEDSMVLHQRRPRIS